MNAQDKTCGYTTWSVTGADLSESKQGCEDDEVVDLRLRGPEAPVLVSGSHRVLSLQGCLLVQIVFRFEAGLSVRSKMHPRRRRWPQWTMKRR